MLQVPVVVGVVKGFFVFEELHSCSMRIAPQCAKTALTDDLTAKDQAVSIETYAVAVSNHTGVPSSCFGVHSANHKAQHTLPDCIHCRFLLPIFLARH